MFIGGHHLLTQFKDVYPPSANVLPGLLHQTANRTRLFYPLQSCEFRKSLCISKEYVREHLCLHHPGFHQVNFVLDQTAEQNPSPYR